MYGWSGVRGCNERTSHFYSLFLLFRCSSRVGKRYHSPGKQIISIGPGCNNVGTIIHEIMHAIGELFAAAYTTGLLWDEFWKTVIVFFLNPFPLYPTGDWHLSKHLLEGGLSRNLCVRVSAGLSWRESGDEAFHIGWKKLSSITNTWIIERKIYTSLFLFYHKNNYLFTQSVRLNGNSEA